MIHQPIYKAASLSVRNQNSLELQKRPKFTGIKEIRDATRGIINTLGSILLHCNHNISTNNLDTIHTDYLRNNNILYSLPESRNKFSYLSNHQNYLRMFSIIIVTAAFVYIYVLVICVILLLYLRCQIIRLNSLV